LLHWHQIWKHMHQLTGKEIEKRAVFELITYIEPQIDALIKQSEKELEELNQLRAIQGVYTKQRIDEQCIRQAIKHIKIEHDDSLSSIGGEQEKEIGEKNESNLPKEENQGVEII